MGRMDPKGAQAKVAAIAAGQHGVITVAQLWAAGLSATQIRNWVRAGRLHRIHRGVYAVGHAALSNEGRWMAAVLACGSGAVLSHRSAAELWRMLDPTAGDIDVTVPTRNGRRRRPGLRIHRSHVPDTASLNLDGIRVTTASRTLIDLGRVADEATYRRALRQAEYQGRDLTGLHTDGTRSDPEALFLRLCRRHRLPTPEVNQRIGSYTVDFLWRGQRLVVEVDAWSSHRGRQAFYDDHQRDLFLRALDYRVLQFTDRQIQDDPKTVAGLVRTKLGA
jgi:very-short-patch-repair endonuclease